jgi:nitrous oxidase accessory protein NosD
MPSAGFEPENPVIEWSQIYAFDRTTKGIGRSMTTGNDTMLKDFISCKPFSLIEESDIVRFCAVRLVNTFPVLRWKISLSSSRLLFGEFTRNLEDDGRRFPRNLRAN